MKTLFFFIAISSFFANLANAEVKWIGSGTIDTRPSLGGRVEIQSPAFPSPPIFERPRYPRYHRVQHCERQLEITSHDGIEIRRTRRYCGRNYRHWDDMPVRYEIREEYPEIEVSYPRIERRSEVRIDLNAPLIGEMIGNILGAGFSARWN